MRLRTLASCPLGEAARSFLDSLDRCREGEANTMVVAESFTGNSGDVRFREQTFAESSRAVKFLPSVQRRHVSERVERAFRPRSANSGDRREAFHHRLAPAHVLR